MACACIMGDTNNTLMTSEGRKLSVNWGSQSFQKRGGSVMHFEGVISKNSQNKAWRLDYKSYVKRTVRSGGREESGINNERRGWVVKKGQLLGEFLYKLDTFGWIMYFKKSL